LETNRSREKEKEKEMERLREAHLEREKMERI
jgi:hypothetical protein